MGGETRYNEDSIFHLERQRGITSEAHSDGQQADDAEIDQDGRLRRVPGILPVRVQDELHGWQSGLREVRDLAVEAAASVRARQPFDDFIITWGLCDSLPRLGARRCLSMAQPGAARSSWGETVRCERRGCGPLEENE